jgi:hypothetical protein
MINLVNVFGALVPLSMILLIMAVRIYPQMLILADVVLHNWKSLPINVLLAQPEKYLPV